MPRPGYRQHLRTVVAGTAAPHGYTLTLWTAGAVAVHAEGAAPSAWDAFLLLLGASLAFGVVGAGAYGGFNRPLAAGQTTPARVWGGMHLGSAGVSILAVALLTHLLSGDLLWGPVGFTATGTYLVATACQFWFAHDPAATSPTS